MFNQKKIFFALLFTILLIFSQPTATFATGGGSGGWGTTNWIGSLGAEFFNELLTTIRESAASAAKMAAISQATSTINSLLYSANEPRNIGNYVTFLAEIPDQAAATYAENFLTEAMRGVSSGDYVGGGGDQMGIGKEIERASKHSLSVIQSDAIPQVDYAEACTSNTFFGDGTFNCFTKVFVDNPEANTPVGMTMATNDAYIKEFLMKQEMQEANASYSGTISTFDEEGNIKIPSSLVVEIQNQQVKIPLEALATGDTKVFSSIINSFAATLVTKIVTEGVQQTSQSIGL